MTTEDQIAEIRREWSARPDEQVHQFSIVYFEMVDYWLGVLGPQCVAVWLVLKRFANSEDMCFPKVATIASMAAMSERQVYRELSRLEEVGLVRHVRRCAERKSSYYCLADVRAAAKKHRETPQETPPDCVAGDPLTESQVSPDCVAVAPLTESQGYNYIQYELELPNKRDSPLPPTKRRAAKPKDAPTVQKPATQFLKLWTELTGGTTEYSRDRADCNMVFTLDCAPTPEVAFEVYRRWYAGRSPEQMERYGYRIGTWLRSGNTVQQIREAMAQARGESQAPLSVSDRFERMRSGNEGRDRFSNLEVS